MLIDRKKHKTCFKVGGDRLPYFREESEFGVEILNMRTNGKEKMWGKGLWYFSWRTEVT